MEREYTDSDGRKCDLPTMCRREPEWATSRVAEGERLAWGVVANAGRMSTIRKVRWSHVIDATGFGSTSAKALCRDAGFDPDEEVGGSDEEEDAPHVCPGCYAVGGERCAPGCIDAEIEAELRHAIESGDYDDETEDDDG